MNAVPPEEPSSDHSDVESAVPAKSANRFARHKWKIRVFFLVVVLIVVELIVRGMMATGLVRYRHFRTGDGGAQFVDDLDPVVGTWHLPDASYETTFSHATLVYRTNSFGMRDPQRELESDAPRRVVVLGDSFVEGWGAPHGKRMTDLLEEQTGVEHLNFGCSGSFGTIQGWLIYKSLATKFDHTEVAAFMLPDNDLVDNNPNKFPKDRYRPYLRPAGDGFELYYPVAFEDRARAEGLSTAESIKHQLYNSIYTLNALRQIDWKPAPKKDGKLPPAYSKVSEKEEAILLESYERLIAEAGDRPVTIYVIPRHREFNNRDDGPIDKKIIRVLKALEVKHERVRVHDLMPYFLGYAEKHGIGWREFFIPSDGHWSELGNRVAAEAVLSMPGVGGPHIIPE